MGISGGSYSAYQMPFGSKASDTITLEVFRLLKVWRWSAPQSTLMPLHLEVRVQV